MTVNIKANVTHPFLVIVPEFSITKFDNPRRKILVISPKNLFQARL